MILYSLLKTGQYSPSTIDKPMIGMESKMKQNNSLKTGQYSPPTIDTPMIDMESKMKQNNLLKDRTEKDIHKGMEYDTHKAEELYNEWLRNINGTGVKKKPIDSPNDLDNEIDNEIKIDISFTVYDDNIRKELHDDIEKTISMMKTEDTETYHPLSNFVALTRDKDIDVEIDNKIALFESREILKEHMGLEKSISNLNISSTPIENSSLLEEDQVESTNYPLEVLGDPRFPAIVRPLWKGHEEKTGQVENNSIVGLQSENLNLSSPGANKCNATNSRIYANKDLFAQQHTNKEMDLCEYVQEPCLREEEGRYCASREMSSNTYSQNQNSNRNRYSQPHYQMNYSSDYRDAGSNNTYNFQNSYYNRSGDSNKTNYQLPYTQLSVPYISDTSTHLPEPSISDQLPELLPLEELEDEEDEEEDEGGVCQYSFNQIPDGEALAEDAVMNIPVPSSRKGREVRRPKNWEFLMRLLADPRANPRLIKWEDRESYTFRLIEPDIIMDIWNSKSKRAPITYNSFARGLRYHYKGGALTLVREHQMVYGCGPIAINLLNKLIRRPSNKNCNINSSFFRPWI